MKISYYEDTDSLYISLSTQTSVDSKVLSDDIVLDIGEHGEPTGIDIQYASKKIDLAELVTDNIPTKKIAVG